MTNTSRFLLKRGTIFTSNNKSFLSSLSSSLCLNNSTPFQLSHHRTSSAASFSTLHSKLQYAAAGRHTFKPHEKNTLRRLRKPKSSHLRKNPEKISFLSRIQTYKAWKHEGFKPNQQLYLEYLHYCVEEAYEHPDRSLETASQLLDDMKQFNVKKDIEIYNRYLQCAVRAHNVNRAKEIYNEIIGPENQLKPTQITYGAMMRVHALNEQKEEAKKYYDEMVERNLVRGDILDFEDVYFGLKTL